MKTNVSNKKSNQKIIHEIKKGFITIITFLIFTLDLDPKNRPGQNQFFEKKNVQKTGERKKK